MHALMPGILLRVAGLDEFGMDAAPQKPHAELGEPGEGATRERCSIVGADPLGQPVLLEEPREHGAHESPRGLEERLTAEQVAAEVVGHPGCTHQIPRYKAASNQHWLPIAMILAIL